MQQQNVYQKIAPLARENGVSRYAVYLWVRSGSIPAAYIRRDRGVTLVHAEGFRKLLEAGRLMRASGRKLAQDSLSEMVEAISSIAPIA